MKVTLRGQNQVMNQSFRMLGLGLILAALLVYCLMVILFQSWLDPFIIMVAVPGALVGILWMLVLTHTTINVESLMGAIMAVGIAVSNSILLVSFANDLRVEKEGVTPLEAALEAGRTRLRPVIMTALAMIIGMIPMALGLGEAGEQNAPLGRAVIGGLGMATVATLFVVPVVYATLRVKLPSKHVMEQKFLSEEREGLDDASALAGATPDVVPPPRRAAGRRPAARARSRRAPPAGQPRRSGLFYSVGILVFAAVVIGVVGIGRHRNHEARDDAQSREAEVKLGPRVRVATVKQAPSIRHLTLQGEARPFFEVTLYAKVAGFLSDLKVDKGDRVKKNQLIAVVTAPELDAQYNAAVADARNKRVNAKRLTALAPAGVVSAQELELGQATADVADATQSAIATQRGYRVIRAPFDGVVTARFADPGTLIQSAANAQSGAVPIVSVSTGAELRIYVYVDQSSAPFVHAGDAAVVTVPERPGWSRQAKIARTSGELSPRTRTMLTEVDISNDDHLIVPGSYVQVTLDVRIPPLLEMPAEALVTRVRQAVRWPSSTAAATFTTSRWWSPATTARSSAWSAASTPAPRVALDLGSSVQDGSPVQVVEAKPPTTPGR